MAPMDRAAKGRSDEIQSMREKFCSLVAGCFVGNESLMTGSSFPERSHSELSDWLAASGDYL